MRSPTRLRFLAAVVALFTLFAGEAVRDTLSWYGFAVWAGVVAVGLAVVGVRLGRARGRERERAEHVGVVSRRGLRPLLNHRREGRAPLLLLGAFLGWGLLSVVWSAYPL